MHRRDLKTWPYCEIIKALAQLMVDEGAWDTDKAAYARIVEHRWPKLTKELRRRERGRGWIECECDLCVVARSEFTD